MQKITGEDFLDESCFNVKRCKLSNHNYSWIFFLPPLIVLFFFKQKRFIWAEKGRDEPHVHVWIMLIIANKDKKLIKVVKGSLSWRWFEIAADIKSFFKTTIPSWRGRNQRSKTHRFQSPSSQIHQTSLFLLLLQEQNRLTSFPVCQRILGGTLASNTICSSVLFLKLLEVREGRPEDTIGKTRRYFHSKNVIYFPWNECVNCYEQQWARPSAQSMGGSHPIQRKLDGFSLFSTATQTCDKHCHRVQESKASPESIIQTEEAVGPAESLSLSECPSLSHIPLKLFHMNERKKPAMESILKDSKVQPRL